MTDEALMRAVAEGDITKLAILFDRHHVALYRFFYWMTRDRAQSEDLVQDVFLRILRYRGRYRDAGDFAAWMYRIARNARFDQAKKHPGEVPLPEEGLIRASDSLETQKSHIGSLTNRVRPVPTRGMTCSSSW